jgi:hypothetical protein
MSSPQAQINQAFGTKKTLYEILGVAKDATAAAIRKAYFKMALTCVSVGRRRVEIGGGCDVNAIACRAFLSFKGLIDEGEVLLPLISSQWQMGKKAPLWCYMLVLLRSSPMPPVRLLRFLPIFYWKNSQTHVAHSFLYSPAI